MTLNALEFIIWGVICFLFGGFCFNKEFRKRVKILIFGRKK